MKNSGRGTKSFIPAFWRAILRTPVVMVLLLIIVFGVYYPSLFNFFIGDDFTWLRWSSDCAELAAGADCKDSLQAILHFFTNAEGFFYRPGTRVYFLAMYNLFSSQYVVYHAVSFLLHFFSAVMVFFLANKFLPYRWIAFATSAIFAVLSVHSETLLWIASINQLIASFLVLCAVMLFIRWREVKKVYLLWLSVIALFGAPMFHELGIIGPPLIILMDILLLYKTKLRDIVSRWYYLPFLLQIPVYLFFRYSANSHWMRGDYSYSLPNLPFNFVGNTIGYIGLILGGSTFLPYYVQLRTSARENVGLTIISVLIVVIIVGVLGYYFRHRMHLRLSKPYVAGLLFFFIPMLPFVGLGNITYRYAYLSSIGVLLLVMAVIASLYTAVPKNMRHFVVYAIVVFGLAYSYYNIMALSKINDDWKQAGEITRSVQEVVASKQPDSNSGSAYYFVNTPIRHGEAWVFPVGLEDAVWNVTRDSSIRVSQISTQEELPLVTTPGERIFIFSQQGVKEVSR